MGFVGFLAAVGLLVILCSSKAASDPQSLGIPVIPFPEVPVSYGFGYEVNDGLGMTQHRHETSKSNGIVEGTYGYSDPLGVYRRVVYTADDSGFRAVVKSNEPGMANSNPADSEFIVEPPPPATVLQGARLIFPVPNTL